MDAEGEVERLEESGVVDDFKERVSRHNRIDTHINSETMTAGTRPTHVHARQNPNKEKGKWVQSPAPSQEATDCCWEEESVFLNGTTLAQYPLSTQTLCSVGGQHKPGSVGRERT